MLSAKKNLDFFKFFYCESAAGVSLRLQRLVLTISLIVPFSKTFCALYHNKGRLLIHDEVLRPILKKKKKKKRRFLQELTEADEQRLGVKIPATLPVRDVLLSLQRLPAQCSKSLNMPSR